MLLLIFSCTFALWFYFKVLKINNYWTEKGVPHIKPWPILGNMASSLFQKRPFPHMLEDIYIFYPNQRYVGMYQFQRPTLLIRDLELIKTIAVRKADIFPNHQLFGALSADPLATKHILNLTVANGWHEMRTTLSPAFTSSKLRSSFVLIEQYANQFVEFFYNQDEITTVELKDAFTRLTNDVFGITQLGLGCNSLKDRNNQLYLIGKSITEIIGWKDFLFTVTPTLMNLLHVSYFNKGTAKSLRQLIAETIKLREEKQIVRLDIINLLVEARKKQKVELTDEDITAQALIFFFGGFDTVATTLCRVTTELALNPDIQEKLWKEIENNYQNETISYETLLRMKYLDCVVSETLRKWPPFAFTDRISIKPFTIEAERPGEKPLFLEENSQIWIPIFPIHRDPNNYPDPDKFDPERFNDENKHNIKPFSYIPFGGGPRICIGFRFALLEMKLVIVKLLHRFELLPVQETKIPLADGGFWLRLKPRNS